MGRRRRSDLSNEKPLDEGGGFGTNERDDHDARLSGDGLKTLLEAGHASLGLYAAMHKFVNPPPRPPPPPAPPPPPPPRTRPRPPFTSVPSPPPPLGLRSPSFP